MKIADYIGRLFKRGTNKINNVTAWNFGDWSIGTMPFGHFIFVSISELLTDLANDVTFVKIKGDDVDFLSFKAFYDYSGQYVLSRLFLDGYVVIGKSLDGLHILDTTEYFTTGNGRNIYAYANDKQKYSEVYVMKSQTFRTFGVSDLCLCKPFVKYIDNALNSSNTILERLGAFIVASPKSATNLPTPITLTKEQKQSLEKEMQDEYGSLSRQKSIMVMPREMNFDTISLATLDIKTNDRIRTAVLAICDKLKVPANQVALIDANSSKSLSNGSELREGDFNKYQSFERLLNATFVRMSEDMRLKVDYNIYNKPNRGLN